MWKRVMIFLQNVAIVLKTGKPRLWLRVIHAIIMMKLFGRSRLRYVDFAIGGRCNLRCSHCFSSATSESDAGQESRIPVSVWRKVVDDAMSLGAVTFSFQGGEPLLYEDLFEYIAASRPRENMISVSTNGTLLTPTMARRLKAAGVDIVTISYDRYHDREAAMRAVHTAVDNSLSVTMAMVVTSGDYFDYELGASGGILISAINKSYLADVRLLLILPVKMGRMESVDLLAAWQCDEIRRIAREHDHVVTDFDVNWGGYGCGAAKEILFIDHRGVIKPCPYLLYSFGNIVRDGLKSVRDYMLQYSRLAKYRQRCIAAEEGGDL